jgi:arginyl-tRNA synthetase
MAEVIEKAKAMTQERGHLDGLNEAERDTLYAQIGLGGLKYYLLKVDPKKRMLFNPEESIDLTGNTGPFLQYAHARISTLLEKANYQPAPIAERVVSSNLRNLRLYFKRPLKVIRRHCWPTTPMNWSSFTIHSTRV